MSIYASAMVAHIAGVMALLVGLVLVITSLWCMRRATSLIQLRKWAGLATKADTLLPLGAVLILLSGLYMTMTVWGWGHGWVNTSLIALLLVSPLVPAVIGPRLAEIRKIAAGLPEGPISPLLRAATQDPALQASVTVMTAVALGIGVMMVTKPATAGSLMVIAIALLVGLAATFPAWRWNRVAP